MREVVRGPTPVGRAGEREAVSSPTVGHIGEFGLIRLIARWTSHQRRSPLLVKGIGDDCATIRTSNRTLFKTDAVVEGVHFRRRWMTARQVGWKALCANVSDVAAAGGRPTAALISLELPGSTPVGWIRDLYSGFMDSAKRYGFAIAGGNISSGPHIAIHVSMLGEAPRRFIGRGGARPGDLVVVTGSLGGSLAGLLCVQRGLRGPDARRAIQAHFRPEPSLAAGRILGRYATALCDISDGLVCDAGHLADESGVQLVLVPGAVPVHAAALAVSERVGRTAIELALESGEEYRLLGTVPRRRYGSLLRAFGRAGLSVAAIGEVRRGRGVSVPGQQSGSLRGFDHFR